MAAAVGSGSPSASVEQSFVNAYNRGQFPLLVALPPLNDVHALGSPGLVQEFSPRSGGNAKYALIKPDPSAPVTQNDTLQVSSDMYAFFTSVGVSTAGYPTSDTTVCPANSVGVCTFQVFTKNYALFVFSSPSVNVAVRDPFFTAWMKSGGLSGIPGPPLSAESTVTSLSKVQAIQQVFKGAAIFSYLAGSSAPSVHAVVEPFQSVFAATGGISTLGLPVTDAVTMPATGLIRQVFEYGRIEQLPSNSPGVLFSLSEVDITYASLGLNLNAGATATISATALDIRGSQVNDRVLTWTSTNGAIVKVTGNGYSATVQGLSGGSASVYATSEGKTSAPLVVRVGSVCCGIGEGAPSTAISQAFQTAVSRNGLSVALPAAGPVTRQGTGYLQTLSAADGSGATYVVALADNTGTAWVLTGPLYSAYLANGGFTGPLGYPASDPLSGGTQRFLSGAVLAGSPVRLLPPVIAARWLQPGSVAGSPASGAANASSFSGASGVSQSFSGGVIFGITGGALSGQAFFSFGPILSRYLTLDGAAGALGFPVSDIFTGGAVSRQNFEAGYIDLQAGASDAVEHFNPRHPDISLTPSVVVPGGRVHVSATGFAPGASLNFTITGQPGFSVTSAAGAYAWDIVIPASAKAGTVSIQASAKAIPDTATASYTVTSVPALLPKFKLVAGDQQTGAPGAALPLPITAVLADSTGAPIAGVPVTYTVSPGASLQVPFATDAAGRVAAIFRLPATGGVAAGSLIAGGQVVEFSALATGKTIPAFPAFTQLDGQGGFIASLASLLRFAQNSGAAGIPNGSATPAALTQYLATHNGFGFSETGHLIANPWQAAQFAGVRIVQEAPDLSRALDLVSAGVPLAAVLRLTSDGMLAGTATVDLTGVNSDGSLAVSDPNPAFARASLGDYLSGFSVQGHLVQGTVTALLRVTVPVSTAGALAFAVNSPVSAGARLASAQGSCSSLDLLDPAVVGQPVGGQPVAPPSGVRVQYCEGGAAIYELDLAASMPAAVADLSGGAVLSLPANGTLAWRLSRAESVLTSAPQTLTIDGITDSAAFAPVLAPGGLFSLFGSGFSDNPAVLVGGKPATIVAAFPFQINARIPEETPPGTATVQVTGALGTVAKDVAVATVAPGIFVIGANAQGALVNIPEGSINSAAAPAQRGQFVSVYTTGLGATAQKNGFQVPNAPVQVFLNSVTVTPTFAGLLPGFVGLYQINVPVPTSLPPSLSGTLSVQAGGRTSNTVAFAVQ